MARENRIAINVNDGRAYNLDTKVLINSTSAPYISSNEKLSQTVQYITALSNNEFVKYTGFTGITITSSGVLDNDYNHIDKGTLYEALTAIAITEIKITVASLSNTPQASGTIQLINAGSETETVSYTSVSLDGLNYVFTVDVTLTNDYDAGSNANTNDPPLIKTTTVDQTDKDTGLFIFEIDANSQPYLLEIEGSASISGCLFEHQVKDTNGDMVFNNKFTMRALNTLDDDAALPPPVGFDFYTKTEINALLSGYLEDAPQDGTTYGRKDGAWSDIGTALGDMTKSVYDPNAKEADVFDINNQVESATKKVMTADERIKLTSVVANANLIDIIEGTNVTIDKTDPQNPIINVNSSTSTALTTSYDNTDSGMSETNVKTAMDKAYAQSIMNNAGMISEPTFVDNLDGTVTIGVGNCILYNNTSWTGELTEYELASATFTLLDSLVYLNYIVADYNSGSPIIRNTNTLAEINYSTVVPIFSCSRNGLNICKLIWNSYGLGHAEKDLKKEIELNRFAIKEGLSLGETGIRNITSTAGSVYYGTKLQDLTAVDTSIDSVNFVYHDTGAWVCTTTTQYSNTQYDNGTDLVDLSVGKYAVNWIYRHVDPDKNVVCVVLANGDYTEAEALESSEPVIPISVSGVCVLIGRIIIKKNDATATYIQKVQSVSLSQSPISSHADLTNVYQAGVGITDGHISNVAQTIAGIKTFSSSPIVPAPTTDLQVATKKYVDDNAGGGGGLGWSTVSVKTTDYTILTGDSGTKISLGTSAIANSTFTLPTIPSDGFSVSVENQNEFATYSLKISNGVDDIKTIGVYDGVAFCIYSTSTSTWTII